MSLYFNEEHEMFRRTVRRFVEQEINPQVDAWEQAGGFDGRTLFKKAGELGLLGMSYPEEYGGMGLDYWFNVIWAEELGRADCGGVPMGLAVHTDMATPALAQHGSDELKQKFLAPAIAGEMIAAIAVTEPDCGSDVAAIRTRAVADGDDYVINGSKMWITNGAQADFVVTLVRTSEGKGFRGLSLVLVPTDTKGFSVSRKLEKMGNHSSDTAELAFEDLRVPQAYRIGPEGMGFMLQMQQFQKERLVGALLVMTAAERAVAQTVAYTRERKTFGRPILDNQWVHFKLCELLTEVEAVRHLCYHCTRALVAGEDITREASMAKLKAGRLAREASDICVQFHGAMGYSEEYPIARYYRDARLVSIGAGADEIMLGILAKIEGMLPGKSR